MELKVDNRKLSKNRFLGNLKSGHLDQTST